MEQKKENMQLLGYADLPHGRYGNIVVDETGAFYDFGGGIKVKVSAIYRGDDGKMFPMLEFKWMDEKPRSEQDPNRAAQLEALDNGAKTAVGDM